MVAILAFTERGAASQLATAIQNHSFALHVIESVIMMQK
jgi:hypothetical protein